MRSSSRSVRFTDGDFIVCHTAPLRSRTMLTLLWVGLGIGLVAGMAAGAGLASILVGRRARIVADGDAERAAARKRALRDSFAALSGEALRDAASQPCAQRKPWPCR